MRRTGISARARARVEREGERALERRKRELVRAHGTLQRVAAHKLDQVRSADEDPRLRATEQLVAGEADEIGTLREARGGRRLVTDCKQRPRAEVVHERDPGSSGESSELTERRLLREPDHPEVRLVHAEDESGFGTDRTLVVGGPCAIRRTDLDQSGTRSGEHVGDPESVADLDQLSPRNEHVAPLGERGERERHGGGVVVDDQRRLTTDDPMEQPTEVIVPRPAGTGVEVVLQVRVAPTHLDDPIERRLGERRAAEIRMNQNAARVEHAAQRWTHGCGKLDKGCLDEVAWISTVPDRAARPLEHGPRRRDGERVRKAREPGIGDEAIDRRKRAQGRGHARKSRRMG